MGMARSCHFRFGENPTLTRWVALFIFVLITLIVINSIAINALDCSGCVNYLSSDVYANYLDEH